MEARAERFPIEGLPSYRAVECYGCGATYGEDVDRRPVAPSVCGVCGGEGIRVLEPERGEAGE